MAVHSRLIGSVFVALSLIAACSPEETSANDADAGATRIAAASQAPGLAPQQGVVAETVPDLSAPEPAPTPAPPETNDRAPVQAPAAQTIAADEGPGSIGSPTDIVTETAPDAHDDAERKAAQAARALAEQEAEADRAAQETALRAEQEAAAKEEAAKQAAERAAQVEAEERAQADARAQAAAEAEAREAQAAREAEARAAQEAAAAAAAVPADGIVTSGSWIKKKRTSNGTWSIVREDGALFVELDEDFSTRNAPDLKLFLSPQSAADVNKNNAVSGSLLISLLDSNKGAQRYAIPDITSLEGYRSIIIHCQDYTVLWSAADL